MNGRTAAVAGAVGLALLLAAACSVSGQPRAAPAPVSPVAATQTVTSTKLQPTTVTETIEVLPTEAVFAPPTGYDDWGDHVAAKWSDQTTFTCAESSESCWGIDLYSGLGCAGGILVVLDIYRDETKLTVIDGTTAAVTPGASVNLVLGQSGNGTGLNAKIADIRCQG